MELNFTAIYEAVQPISSMPFDKSTVPKLLTPLALPIFFVAALQIPIDEMALKLAEPIV